MNGTDLNLEQMDAPALRLLVSQLLETNEKLLRMLEAQRAEMDELKRLLFGQKSERIEPMDRSMRWMSR